MGCCASRSPSAPTPNIGRSPRIASKGSLGIINKAEPPMRPESRRRSSVAGHRVTIALQKKMFELQDKPKVTLTRVILQFAKLSRVMRDIRMAFFELSGGKQQIQNYELTRVMEKLHGSLSQEEVFALFKLSDMNEKGLMDFREFLVCLTVGYVMEVIPALRDDNLTMQSCVEAPAIPEGEEVANADGTLPATTIPTHSQGVRRVSELHSQSNFFGHSKEIKEMMNLILQTYLMFDTEGRGYISKGAVEPILAEGGSTGHDMATNFLSQQRWAEMDWDSNGNIDFEEFVFTFCKWIELGEDEEEN